MAELIDVAFRLAGNKETVILADRLKEIGYRFSTIAGISICLDDMVIPETKQRYIDAAVDEVREIQQQYTEGLITDGERYNKVIDIWASANERVSKAMMENLSKEKAINSRGEEEEQRNNFV